MARKFTESKLVVATHNQGKLREISALLAPFNIEVTSAGALGLPEPEETEDTFIGNARLKSDAASQASGLPALADDSGLAVTALKGAPGIYSARWAGPTKDFTIAMEEVQKQLGDAEDRSATFYCALSLSWPDGHCDVFEGRCSGHLVWPPRGTLGFGYDPMFVADGETITFGEMDPARKHAMSHRNDAFQQLVDACFTV